MIVLNIALVCVFFLVVPLVIGRGIALITKEYVEIGPSAIAFWYLLGTFAMWAVYQLTAVPVILAKQRFMLTVAIWLIVILAIIVGSVIIIVKKHREATTDDSEAENKESFLNKYSKKSIIFFSLIAIVTLLMVGYQCSKYAFRMHIDDDDARYIVNAVEAYEKDTLLVTNPATGEVQDMWVKELRKDVASPWMIYVALMSKLVVVHPTILAHTILPVVLLLMSYMSYWLIGAQIFKERKMYCMLTVMFAAILNMFFSDTTHTQAYVTLVRLWQGKAVVAAIMIPVIMALLYRLYREQKQTGLFAVLFITATASCLLSGMGIFLNGIMIGLYGLYSCIVTKQFKAILGVIVACIPTLVYGLLYYFMG